MQNKYYLIKKQVVHIFHFHTRIWEVKSAVVTAQLNIVLLILSKHFDVFYDKYEMQRSATLRRKKKQV